MSNTDYENHETTGKISKPFFKNWFVWAGMIGLLLITVFTIFFGYQVLFQIPTEKQAELENEFKAIAPLPNANLVNYIAWQKITFGSASATYLTDINSDDIFKYYNEQLKQRGWRFVGTKKMTGWGKDLGGKAADYCKGDYWAELFYAGEKAHYGWTYDFGVSWGSHDCKTGK